MIGALLLALAGMGGDAFAEPAEPTLPAALFAGGEAPATALPTSVFTPPPGAQPASMRIIGKLTLAGEPADRFSLIADDFGSIDAGEPVASLPPLEIELVAAGDEVIPARRGPIAGNHPYWEWIVEPGKTWEDPSRPGTSMVALPFSLIERNANCIHNGLLLIAIGTDGTASRALYQIGSETCAYLQFDMWGIADVAFTPGEVAGSDRLTLAYDREKAERRPVRPISDLGNVATAGFGSPEEVAPAALTTFGYASGGTLFAGPCPTRHGPYPYCDVLDLPSYSWAKSLVGGIAAMRLEFLFPGAMEAKISDFVPECLAADWQGVTFRNAIDMASGHYNSDKYDEDEASPQMRAFFLAETHAEKIALACTAFPRKDAPGRRFVYRTADTYILGTAMAAYLRQHVEGDVDLYDGLIVPIWKALGLSPATMVTRRTLDSQRQPFTGWGLVLHRNDIAVLADFLQRGGTIGGQPLLDRAMLNEALQRDKRRRGLRAVVETQRYQHGFWAWNAAAALGCAGEAWIPALSGYGGLSAALMPNGATYFYISDGGQFAWARAAAASNRLAPFCERLQ